MQTNKRILGNYTVNTVDSSNSIAGEVTFNTLKVNIQGDLDVFGTVNKITENELEVIDKSITLNVNETGDGISGAVGEKHSGLIVERGNWDTVGLRYNEEADPTPGVGLWEITNDGTNWYPILTSYSFSGLTEIWEDKDPQLGGDLIVNSNRDTLDTWKITSRDNKDVIIDAHGTGQVKLDHVLSLENQILNPPVEAGYNKMYAKIPASGGSGIFFNTQDASSNTVQDELVSKTKAIVYSIIF